jgi:hypothetical protein
MWWWHSRGYTPAGVEAWNCIRALDYLETRPEVDTERFGVTGRSGGGAYSWWIAALDERIKVAVPVAGITSLQNHVVDGCIEGHCDCMFMVNTYRWDFPQVAALVAPRPLLISNTDKDRIFPLDGVYDVYVKTRRIYELYRATDKIGLHITEGPHKDTQELRAHAFVWFDRYLKGGSSTDLDIRAPKLFEPEELKVFDVLPAEECVTNAHEWFVPQAVLPAVPKSSEEWTAMRDAWVQSLKERVFRGLRSPISPGYSRTTPPRTEPNRYEADGMWLMELYGPPDDDKPYDIWMLTAKSEFDVAPERITVKAVDQAGWETFRGLIRAGFPDAPWAQSANADAAAWTAVRDDLMNHHARLLVVCPRGLGRTEWTRDAKERTHILRRFALLGRSVDVLRTLDVREALRTARRLANAPSTAIHLEGAGEASVWCLYAALQERPVSRVELTGLPASHAEGPALLNVLKCLDLPQALAMAAADTEIILHVDDPSQAAVAEFARQTAERLDWAHPIEIVTDHRGPLPSVER